MCKGQRTHLRSSAFVCICMPCHDFSHTKTGGAYVLPCSGRLWHTQRAAAVGGSGTGFSGARRAAAADDSHDAGCYVYTFLYIAACYIYVYILVIFLWCAVRSCCRPFCWRRLLHIHYCYVGDYFMYVYVFSCILLVLGVRCAATADDCHEAGCYLYTFFDVADYYMHIYLLCWGVVRCCCRRIPCRRLPHIYIWMMKVAACIHLDYEGCCT